MNSYTATASIDMSTGPTIQGFVDSGTKIACLQVRSESGDVTGDVLVFVPSDQGVAFANMLIQSGKQILDALGGRT